MLQEIFVLAFAYVCLVAWAQPRRRPVAIEPEAQPVDYFPEVDQEDEEYDPVVEFECRDLDGDQDMWVEIVTDEEIAEALSVQPITIVEPLPVAAFVAPKAPKTIANLIVEEATKADIVRPNYDAMGVRELYKIASAQGIKGYKKLSKANLIALLQ